MKREWEAKGTPDAAAIVGMLDVLTAEIESEDADGEDADVPVVAPAPAGARHYWQPQD